MAQLTCSICHFAGDVIAVMQTKNALERLAATFVEGHMVDQSFGGEATTQDLVRLVLCAHIACDRDIKRSNDIVSEADSQALMPSFLTAISAVLPDIITVLQAEPDATALERAGDFAGTPLLFDMHMLSLKVHSERCSYLQSGRHGVAF